MSLGSLNGRARVSTRSPVGAARCDRCGFVYQRTQLRRQFYWRGNALADSGLLVCYDRCLDVPNEQYRAIILPGDPQPFQNPRPDPALTPPRWLDAFQSPPTQTSPSPTPGNFGFLDYQIGSIVDQTYPTTKQGVLDAVAAASEVPTPVFPVDWSIIFERQAVSQSLMPANADRTWLLVWNPTHSPAVFSTGTSNFGATTVLTIGPGQAWIQADLLGGAATYKGALTAAGLTVGLPLWAWDYPYNPITADLDNDGGFLVFVDGSSYPQDPTGLPAGAIWSNGRFVACVPGLTPDPSAPPVYFGQIVARNLVLLGGGNLPLTPPTPGSLQLWNNAGFVCVA